MEDGNIQKDSQADVSKQGEGKQPKVKSGFVTVGLIVIVSTSAGFIGGYYGSGMAPGSNRDVKQAQNVATSESQLITKIAEDVGPSVVSVNVLSESVQNGIFGPQSVAQENAGTGVIVDADGIIITNRHVVPKGTSEVSITLSDGTELKDVEVLGRTGDGDPLDIAFLKVKDKKGKELKPAKLGDSSKVQVGDKVVAIGNALGEFQNTVTSGIISGYGRNVEAGDAQSSESLQNLFQTDAAINQGNSGGPLVNMSGEVIGINTAVAAGEAQNIGFAIPISDVKGLVNGVLKTGKLERSYLGVIYVPLDEKYAYEYNLDAKEGAYLAPNSGKGPVLPGSPAEKAGLKEKDIIIKVNDTDINDKNSLTSVIGQYAVGDKVNLTVIRGGQTQNVEATLEAAPTN